MTCPPNPDPREWLGFMSQPWLSLRISLEHTRPDVAQRRDAWRRDQLGLDAGNLIFIDEAWANTNLTRLRGRAPRGEQLVDRTPHGQWKTSTLIAALDVVGVRCATMVNGAIDADVFNAFVERVLLPELRPGDVAVLDNFSRRSWLTSPPARNDGCAG
jgi:hypothetical protein